MIYVLLYENSDHTNTQALLYHSDCQVINDLIRDVELFQKHDEDELDIKPSDYIYQPKINSIANELKNVCDIIDSVSVLIYNKIDVDKNNEMLKEYNIKRTQMRIELNDLKQKQAEHIDDIIEQYENNKLKTEFSETVKKIASIYSHENLICRSAKHFDEY